MRYKCLVADHDDTVVNSTATVHYPSFVEYEKIYHPEVQMSLEEYFEHNFDPGVYTFFHEILGMDEAEMKREEAFWREYAAAHSAPAYPGMKEILERVKAEGGILCVDSHSFTANILRDYRESALPMPDLVYGWDLEKDKRKPAPWTLFEIMKKFDLKPSEILVLDDLKPGYDMARATGVDFAAAGWANDIPSIENFMRENCDFYFKTIREFEEFFFS